MARRVWPRGFYFGLGAFSVVLIAVSLWMLVSNNSGGLATALESRLNLPIETPTHTPTARPSPTATPPRKTSTPRPTITPTATRIIHSEAFDTFDWSRCHAAYSTRVRPGDTVEIGSFYSPFGYQILEGPYIDRDPVGELSPGDRVTIINGPSCSNKWIWWIIAVEGSDETGWFPEGDANSYWLVPVHEALEEGQARISNQVGAVNLRRSPGYRSKNDNLDVIVEIHSGETVRLLEGPRVVEGLNWWYVEWNGYEGWVAERSGTGRTILVFNP